jgi:hypothetical protein
MNQFFDDEDDGKDFETETKPGSVQNSDSNSLPSTGAGVRDDEEKPTSYIPTREEILLLVKHWETQVLDAYWFCFMSGACGLYVHDEKVRANSRFELAEAAIGEEAVRAAIDEANEEFKREYPEWLWEIFVNGSDKQEEEVHEESLRGGYGQYSAGDLKQMEELETKHPKDLIGLVLDDIRAGDRSTVLGFSTADSELVPLLEACPQFQVLTTKSRIRRVTANRTLRYRGFIRARRRGRDWLFDFPGTTPGTVAYSFLEYVRNQIKKVLSDAAEREAKAQRKEVEENSRKFTEDDAADALKHLEQLEKMYPDCAVALVLRGPLADKDRAVLITLGADPELLALLQGGGRLEIETDRSRVKTLLVDQGFSLAGQLEINRGGGSLGFQETRWRLGIDGWNFLMNVKDQVWELIHGGIAKNSRNQ